MRDSNRVGRFLGWLAASGLGLTCLTIAAVHAPNRIKLLGLFAMGYGLAAGFWMGRLARTARLGCAKTIAVLSFLMVVLSMLGLTLRSQWIYAEAINREYRFDPSGQIAGSTGEAADLAAQSQLQQLLQESRQERRQKLAELTSFSAYLSHRTAGGRVGNAGWPHPWPWTLWVLEVFLSGIAGAALTVKVAASPIDASNSVG